MTQIIRIGTRGSQLALYQAEKVKSLLEKAHPELTVEIVIIKTKGDKILDVSLSKIGDKGLFTKEIENALLDNSVDIAVHSLKDLPTTLPEGLKLGAVLERGEYRDALVSRQGKKLADLGAGDVVATSSLRRQAGLLQVSPEVTLKDIRGNVNTRLKRMEEGYCDAMIMAAAGLQRLGLDRYITEIIEPNQITPAVSQGIIAIEIRENDLETEEILSKINHPDTLLSAIAERAFLAHLQGGCQVPVGCYSSRKGSEMELHGFVASVDGKRSIKQSIKGEAEDARMLGIALANSMISEGADKILDEIRS
ncbi:MAG: hydroxymethylbilane synthase [Bacteroidales bacterium]|nr:hydroxymethylbilane synthase [Bacteroidales bacterium]